MDPAPFTPFCVRLVIACCAAGAVGLLLRVILIAVVIPVPPSPPALQRPDPRAWSLRDGTTSAVGQTPASGRRLYLRNDGPGTIQVLGGEPLIRLPPGSGVVLRRAWADLRLDAPTTGATGLAILLEPRPGR